MEPSDSAKVTSAKNSVADTSNPNSSTDEDKFKDDPEDIICSWHTTCRPDSCQQFARPSCLMVWLCLSGFTQGLVVNGFVNSVLTTLELRYDMSSAEGGLIASMYDIGCLLFLVPVTYFGRRFRRSRLISIGLLVMAVGSFVFAIPQFTTEAYNYQSPVSPLCYISGKTYPDFCKKQTLNNYKFVFWLGQFLHGIGASPLYTLAVAYLDDNLTIQQSGAFLGAYYTMSLIGPAFGYLLGGLFLDIFVEPGKRPTDLSPSNTSLWVGAWWIGFLISGVLALIVVIPMFGFPVSFPGSARIRHERKKAQETHGNSESKSSEIELRAKDILPAMKIIMTNPTFFFLSFGGAAQGVILTGLSTFGPKIFQTLFYMSAGSSTFTMGLVTIPSAAAGMLIGGLAIKFTNFSLRFTLWLCVAVTSIDAMFVVGLLARCNIQKYAGVNYNYPLTPNQPSLLNASCNSNCNCQESKFMYSPLCGADSIIYYSPCYAGCETNGILIGSTRYYANCSCISSTMKVKGANYSGFDGMCKDPGCDKLPIFIVLMGSYIFGIFVVCIPLLQCTMRVIPAKLKDFGLGLQWVIFRLFGGIPGPLLLGKLIDTACSLWTGGCGQRVSCSFYNGEKFFVVVIIFSIAIKGMEIVCLILSAALYVSPQEADLQKDLSLQEGQTIPESLSLEEKSPSIK